MNRVRKIARRAAEQKAARKRAKDEQRERANANRRKNRPARFAALLALVLAVLAGAACQPSTGQPVAQPPSGDLGSAAAVVFGDSLCADASQELAALYVADDLWRHSLNCYGGTEFETDTWTARYPNVTAPPSQTAVPVILALGTNDMAADPDLATTKQQFRTAVVAATDAGAGVVVVPTVSSSFVSGARQTRTRAWNAFLWQADASAHPDWRALRVADWDGEAASHPEWHRITEGDPVHHTAAGQAAYAGFLYRWRTAVPGA